MLNIGDKVEDLLLTNQNGESFKLSSVKEKYIILYFYPKDLTSGCTIEANAYNALLEEFKKEDVLVLGVSKDSAKSHLKFIDKNCLKFDLIVDENLTLNNYFDVYKEKSMYGKKYFGTVRTTFILDHDLNVLKINSKVSTKDDAKTNLEFIKNLK